MKGRAMKTCFASAMLGVVAVAISLSSFGISHSLEASEPEHLSVDILADLLGYELSDRDALLSGEIIATDIERTADNDLVAAVAVLVEASIDQIAEIIFRISGKGPEQATTVQSAFQRLLTAAGAG